MKRRNKDRPKTTPRFGHQSKEFPRSLGDVPIVVRSLRAVGGERAGCKFTKKRARMARKGHVV